MLNRSRPVLVPQFLGLVLVLVASLLAVPGAAGQGKTQESRLPSDVIDDEDRNVIVGRVQIGCKSECLLVDYQENINDTSDPGAETGCGRRCRIDYCSTGCRHWVNALGVDGGGCRRACNSTAELLTIKELYCNVGCKIGLRGYYREVKKRIGKSRPPLITYESLTPISLTLEWNDSNGGWTLGLKRFAQQKYEQSPEDVWRYCNQTLGENGTILVNNLQPYTKYQFRVGLVLGYDDEEPEDVVFSEESPVVFTPASGPPTSAPEINKALAIDRNRVFVSWLPGKFTNGPILSYVLRLQKAYQLQTPQLKELPVTQRSFTFQDLDPNTNYSIILTARNSDGEGPADFIFVSTLSEPPANIYRPNYLIVQEHSVLLRSTEDNVIFELPQSIRDSAVHVALSELFVTDSDNRLNRISFEKSNSLIENLKLDYNDTSFRPWQVSVDWLNYQLYVFGVQDNAGRWEIAKCNYDGRNLETVVSGLDANSLKQLEVDPYNGFLFWNADDNIYRLELSPHNNSTLAQAEYVFKGIKLGHFVLDYESRRILIIQKTDNQVVMTSYFGEEVIDLRSEEKLPYLDSQTTITIFDRLLYFTNETYIIEERYDTKNASFVYDVLNDRKNEDFQRIHLLSESLQPIPIPLNPPSGINLLPSYNRIRISWSPPKVLKDQSNGAWDDWTYRVSVEDNFSEATIEKSNIEKHFLNVNGLREDSVYTIKIAASSKVADGPWSQDFRVRTLGKDNNTSIVWSTGKGLYQTDLIGQNAKLLINNKNASSLNVTQVVWYSDLILSVINDSSVHQYNITSNTLSILPNVFAHRIAIDWIGHKIYWCDRKKNIIIRSNLNGLNQEPLPILSDATNLLIDSLNTYLYWSTVYGVHVSRLTGDERRTYYLCDQFAEERIAGFTVDLRDRFVYWMVDKNNGYSNLYRSSTIEEIDDKLTIDFISTFETVKITHTVSFVNHRFLWYSNPNVIYILDQYGQHASRISSPTNDTLYSISIMDSALYQYPVNFTLHSDPINVKPLSVDLQSIKIRGIWRDFNLTWAPVTNVNYGTVFYEIEFEDYANLNTLPLVTTKTNVPYSNADRIPPYSTLGVSIRAYTYWDSSKRTSVFLKSPQTVPSQPLRPRLYSESFKGLSDIEVNVFVTFRWSMPEFANGEIKGFIVDCWYISEGNRVTICNSVTVELQKMEYKVYNLHESTEYYFRVCAFSTFGIGPYTEAVSLMTDNENPLPQLLIATLEDVEKLDLDQNATTTITNHIAVEMAHLAFEEKIYWINEMQELVTADVDGESIVKILTLNNTAMSLCADWISRSLFWTETNYEENGMSHILKLDITAWENNVLLFKKIASRKRRIVNLDVSPLTGSLFWIELTSSSLGFIIQSDLLGNNVEPFFNHIDDCTCPFKPQVQPAFAIDSTEPNDPVIYWISSIGQIYISDIDGCTCNLVLDVDPEYGLPPTTLTVDKKFIYWSNMETERIYFIDKHMDVDNVHIKTYGISNARSIKAIGKSLQPYPDATCLLPQNENYSVDEIKRTSTSISVKLPNLSTLIGCEYDLPATLYTVEITKCDTEPANNFCEDNSRKEYKTYSRDFKAEGLTAFTRYSFKVALSNYYGDREVTNPEFGSSTIIRTLAGIPSKVEDFEVQSLTPNLAIVIWTSSKVSNAEFVKYKVFWYSHTISSENSHNNKTENSISGSEDYQISKEKYYLLIRNLQSRTLYKVYIRAYPENYTDIFSESDTKQVETLPEPEGLLLAGVASNALNVSWKYSEALMSSFRLQYSRKDYTEWREVDDFDIENKTALFHVYNLEAKTEYIFRLLIRYKKYDDDFIWSGSDGFHFQTLGDVPTVPGSPILIHNEDSQYQLIWEASRTLERNDIVYVLDGQVSNRALDKYGNDVGDWNFVYNGTENYWNIPDGLDQRYLFRVRAKTAHGMSEWSSTSPVIDLTIGARAMIVAQKHLGLLIGLFVPIIVILLCFTCYAVCPFCRKSKKDQLKLTLKSRSQLDLASLKEVPKGSFVEINATYILSGDHEYDDSLLPKIKREQISLAKFLGSGAFGEVYQGTVVDIDGPNIKTPVAVKTLRNGASSQEKNEFLQEAKLMSHFHHKHVLKLIGVCLDTDPPFLLLELMAGGDLLSYLRTSRSLRPTDPDALRLQDLLSICEDVARGCRYLEELHYVHRDLACRNCLVSARDRPNRVVKIGDFGLARDIYKNDYYRKEGEGLLPVRWMAPESLVDGVFTSQSDVWSFGVLMWEITSLGQQPYQARTNVEVLHHVRAGGRLPKPLNCPPRLHHLMLRCWNPVNTRPSFKICLDTIVSLRSYTEDCTLSPVNPGSFNSTIKGNIYKTSEIKNLSTSRPRSDQKSDLKYSWLMGQAIEVETSDDFRSVYEVPKSIPVIADSKIVPDNRYVEILVNNKCNERNVLSKEENSVDVDFLSTDAISKVNINEECSIKNRLSNMELDMQDKLTDKANLSENKGPQSLPVICDKLKNSDSARHGNSYARIVGNQDGVTSLSDWRRFKKIANEERERLNMEKSNIMENRMYGIVDTNAQMKLSSSKDDLYHTGSRTTLSKHKKSCLTTNRANIPLVINSGLLNMLRHVSGSEDESDSEISESDDTKKTINVSS